MTSNSAALQKRPPAPTRHAAFDRLLGTIEIWGGAYGLYFTVVALDQGKASQRGGAVLLLLAASYFSLSVCAGMFLLRSRPGAKPLSIAVQAAQVVQVSVGGIVVGIWSGARLAVGLSGWTIELTGDLGSRFKMSLFAPATSPSLELNLVAVAALCYLIFVRERTRIGA